MSSGCYPQAREWGSSAGMRRHPWAWIARITPLSPVHLRNQQTATANQKQMQVMRRRNTPPLAASIPGRGSGCNPYLILLPPMRAEEMRLFKNVVEIPLPTTNHKAIKWSRLIDDRYIRPKPPNQTTQFKAPTLLPQAKKTLKGRSGSEGRPDRVEPASARM